MTVNDTDYRADKRVDMFSLLTSWYSLLLSKHPQLENGTHLSSLSTKPALHWQPSTQVFGGSGQKIGKRSAQVGGHGGVHSEKWLLGGHGRAENVKNANI